MLSLLPAPRWVSRDLSRDPDTPSPKLILELSAGSIRQYVGFFRMFRAVSLWSNALHFTTKEQVFRNADIVEISIEAHSPSLSKTPEELADIISRFAASDGWLDRVRL